MSHKPTPYSPNFPTNQGYAPPEDGKKESYPMAPSQYPASASAPVQVPMPMPGMQPGFQPGMQSGFQPGMQPGFQPGMQPGYQPGMQPGYQPGMQPGFQPGMQPGFQQEYSHPPPLNWPVPVVQQPGQQPTGGWMNIPQGLSNCPPGLEYLSMINQLLVHQKVELIEAFTGFETNNKYTVKNNLGQKMYVAVEDNDCCTRNCCGPGRPFDMKIYDNFQNEVIHLNRPLACDSCCCPCWLQSIEVTAPPGTLIGTVQQEWSIFKPSFAIKNAAGDTVLRIEGPFCTFSICGDVEFDVYSKDGETKVGKITKQWSGLAREVFTDSDYFGISFPMDLDVRMKAVMLGACFLIDYMFFEKQGNKESDRPGML